ncbi:MAG: ATP phosphoribosyltransferase regulatory subunit [Cellvibrionales bacterium]|nr:ATP phosphoribosyltransferase regulatory subunit [Cellvibrionales bacterium]
MKTLNRWLLPKGVEEILPKQAWLIKQYERSLLDLYHAWGYELVIPPLIEYQESLLAGLGQDVDLLSFKLTDQLSGRTLAVRSDMTPQAARIDAHSWAQKGVTRLCYSGTVLHTRPKNALASRTPIEIGAELYGDDSINSDLEVIQLMLASLRLTEKSTIHLDIGHVGIYRALVGELDLPENTESELFGAFDRKSEPEIDQILAPWQTTPVAQMLKSLVGLNGGEAVLDQATNQLAHAPSQVLEALTTIKQTVEQLKANQPDLPIMIDLAELRGYQYHTGMVFSAYIEGIGHAVANGGRYDGIGALFGRDRPATGFTINVNSLVDSIVSREEQASILAPGFLELDGDLQAVIARLRADGQRVIYQLGEELPAHCTKKLSKQEGQWIVTDL